MGEDQLIGLANPTRQRALIGPLEVPMESDDILRDMDYQADYEAELQRWQLRSADQGRETRGEGLGRP